MAAMYPYTYGPAVCRHCGETFELRCTNQVYCSSGCRWNWWWVEKQRRKPRLRLGIRQCAGCGEWFTPWQRRQKCCDVECGKAYMNHRRHLRIRECAFCGQLSLGSFRRKYCGARCKWWVSRPEASDAGLVYFIQGVDGGPIKVGRSVDPQKRLGELQTGHFQVLVLRAMVVGGARLERELHRRLAEHRLLGEWFSPAPEVVATMEEYAADQIRLVA